MKASPHFYDQLTFPRGTPRVLMHRPPMPGNPDAGPGRHAGDHGDIRIPGGLRIPDGMRAHVEGLGGKRLHPHDPGAPAMRPGDDEMPHLVTMGKRVATNEEVTDAQSDDGEQAADDTASTDETCTGADGGTTDGSTGAEPDSTSTADTGADDATTDTSVDESTAASESDEAPFDWDDLSEPAAPSDQEPTDTSTTDDAEPEDATDDATDTGTTDTGTTDTGTTDTSDTDTSTTATDGAADDSLPTDGEAPAYESSESTMNEDAGSQDAAAEGDTGTTSSSEDGATSDSSTEEPGDEQCTTESELGSDTDEEVHVDTAWFTGQQRSMKELADQCESASTLRDRTVITTWPFDLYQFNQVYNDVVRALFDDAPTGLAAGSRSFEQLAETLATTQREYETTEQTNTDTACSATTI